MAVVTATVAVLSQISIPMPYGVPLTFQTFAVPLAGILLGPVHGAISMLIYILLGAVGIPVFAGFNSGLGTILGVTGGFILAFPIMAFLTGLGAKKMQLKNLVLYLGLAILIEYTIGTVQFMIVSKSNFMSSLLACVVPFIPTEVIKGMMVCIIGIKCKKIMLKSGLIRA